MLAAITDGLTIRRILAIRSILALVGLPTEPLQIAPAREPPQQVFAPGQSPTRPQHDSLPALGLAHDVEHRTARAASLEHTVLWSTGQSNRRRTFPNSIQRVS
jgi:hypothetical protein